MLKSGGGCWRTGRSMVTLALVALGIPVGAASQGVPQDDDCIRCHLDLDEERLVRPAQDYETDLHAEVGFGCLDCHGPAAGLAVGTGFLGKPERRQVAQLCGRCHSDADFMRQFDPALRVDQVTEYATSVHGRRLARDNDRNVAVCTSCHPAHAIKPPSDPQSSVHPLNVGRLCGNCHSDPDVVGQYDVRTDQEARYERSVHWRWMTEEEDLSAPTCNDCHGNHGAAPPGVLSVQNVCGQCHSVMQTFFDESAHAEYFGDANLPSCATCHGNHEIDSTNDEMLLTFADSVCALCHTQGDTLAGILPVMKTLIDSLRESRERAHEILLEARNAGMEVSRAQFELEDATNALVKARTAIHAFTADSVKQEMEAGLVITRNAYERGVEALDEHLFRRQGLAVSVALILVLIAGLMMKIRQLERSSRVTDAQQGDISWGGR